MNEIGFLIKYLNSIAIDQSFDLFSYFHITGGIKTDINVGIEYQISKHGMKGDLYSQKQ